MTTDIREAFREAWGDGPVGLADAITETTATTDSLFDINDLRESELRALDALTAEAREAVQAEFDAIVARYRDLLEDAVARFVEEHPTAPRRKAATAA